MALCGLENTFKVQAVCISVLAFTFCVCKASCSAPDEYLAPICSLVCVKPSDHEGHVGSYQGPLWVSCSLDLPVKFLADLQVCCFPQSVYRSQAR